MRKIDFKFSDYVQSIEEIDYYHRQASAALKHRYSQEYNPTFLTDFPFKTPREINDEYVNALAELDREVSFCILALIEARFRIDFIIRCQMKKKDKLSKIYRSTYNPSKRIYTYSYVDTVLNGWKNYRTDYGALIDRIIDATNYRNWLAHGRYWQFRDNLAKYTVASNLDLARNLLNSLGNDLMTPPKIGAPL